MRIWLLVLSLVVLSLSVLVAFFAAGEAVEIWLRPQFAPFVHFGGAVVIAVLALLVVLRLTRRT